MVTVKNCPLADDESEETGVSNDRYESFKVNGKSVSKQEYEKAESDFYSEWNRRAKDLADFLNDFAELFDKL